MSYTHFGQLCQRCKKSYTPLCIEKNIPGLHYIGVKLVKRCKKPKLINIQGLKTTKKCLKISNLTTVFPQIVSFLDYLQ